MNELKGMTVVVADDQQEMREMLVRGFAKQGCSVFEAEGGRKAFELVSANRPALLVSDIEMPEGDGLELLGRLQDLSAPPLAVMISAASQPMLEEAKKRGAAAVLAKPFTFRQLLDLLQTLLPPA